MSDRTQAWTPLVSVLTPSYNQATWLSANLESVACQTYPSIEHIVMDGGSNDESVAILEAAGDSVTWRSEPDRGQADAVNKAFSASSGEIVGWLNSDDAYFDCDVVEDVVRFFECNPSVDVVYGHAARVAPNGAVISIIWVPGFSDRRLKVFDYIVQPSAFIRRRVLTEPMLDVSMHFAMDYELWLRLAKQGKRFRRLHRVVGIDRVQPAQKTKTSLDVWEHDIEDLALRYGQHYPSYWSLYIRAYHVYTRLAGALMIPRAPRALAFPGPADPFEGLLKRQVFTRRSDWPEEYK